MRFSLWFSFVLVVLSGCGGSQSQVARFGALPGTATADTHAQEPARSRTLPASSNALIYATGGCGGVCVLSYPEGQLLDSITLGGTLGDCSDSSGNVFVTHENEVLEYAHGGTTPIASLSVPGTFAMACSVDDTTGNLAVVFSGTGSNNIAIFPDAQGTPTLYDSHLTSVYCGYDDAGNLFVSGGGAKRNGLSELQSGATKFLVLSLKGQLGNPGQVQWDGTYITYEQTTPSDIKLSRLLVSGSSVKIVSTTRFKGRLRNANQSWIYGNMILIPYAAGGMKFRTIGLWKYPNGGKPIAKFGHFPDSKAWRFQGVTVSV